MLQELRLSADNPTTLGRYELLTELASGGMGTVYLARLQGLGGFERLFAIKVLHKSLSTKSETVGMLLDEARLAAHLHHPNIISTVDAGVSEAGRYYLVMDYVNGFTLSDVLERVGLEARQRMRIALRILLDAATGLHAAHRWSHPVEGTPLKIVHRDVSTDNILVSLHGTGHIADFGIAWAIARTTSTQPGTIKGTPQYMAPEQVTGESDVDARADVFGLGAVLWETLAGEVLFSSTGGYGAVLQQVLQGVIDAPSARDGHVPVALDHVCLKALNRDREARYQSAGELVQELEAVAREHDLLASSIEVSAALQHLFKFEIEARQTELVALTEPRISDIFPAPILNQPSPAPGRAAARKQAKDETTLISVPIPGLRTRTRSALWLGVALVALVVVAGTMLRRRSAGANDRSRGPSALAAKLETHRDAQGPSPQDALRFGKLEMATLEPTVEQLQEAAPTPPRRRPRSVIKAAHAAVQTASPPDVEIAPDPLPAPTSTPDTQIEPHPSVLSARHAVEKNPYVSW